MKKKLAVTVLGAGSWGTTFAALASRNASVVLWARDAAVAQEIGATHRNTRYLPDAELPARLHAQESLAAAVERADVLVLAVPSHGVREVLLEASAHIR